MFEFDKKSSEFGSFAALDLNDACGVAYCCFQNQILHNDERQLLYCNTHHRQKNNHHFNRLQKIDKDHFEASEAVDQLTSIIQMANL